MTALVVLVLNWFNFTQLNRHLSGVTLHDESQQRAASQQQPWDSRLALRYMDLRVYNMSDHLTALFPIIVATIFPIISKLFPKAEIRPTCNKPELLLLCRLLSFWQNFFNHFIGFKESRQRTIIESFPAGHIYRNVND